MRILTGGRRVRRRGWWLAGGAVTAVAGVLTIALVVQASPTPVCAAPPAAGTTHRGKATFYTLSDGGGNCSYDGPPPDGLFVALGSQQYADAAACGGYLDVTGPKGRVRVKIIDRCPECSAGHIDLSATAFRKIADPVQGVVPVTFRAVANPPLPGPLTFRVKEGASRYWFALRVDNTGNPLASVRAKTAGGTFRALTRTDYNYWLADSGLGPGPFTIQVTDTRGHTATVGGVTLRPGVTQTSRVRLYDAAGAAPRPVTTRTATSSPTADATTAPATSTFPARRSVTATNPTAPAVASASEPATIGGDCTR